LKRHDNFMATNAVMSSGGAVENIAVHKREKARHLASIF
jgi:hypothetical protein